MNFSKNQRGIAMVETVITLPVILFLVLVGAEITNAFVDHNTLTKAARNAVRHLANHAIPGTAGVVALEANVISETQNLLVYGNTTGAGTPILPGLAPANVQVANIGNNNVQVSVAYGYNGILGNTLAAFGFGPDSSLAMTLQASGSMRAL